MWTPGRAAQIASLFDPLASGWRERDGPERHEALVTQSPEVAPFPSGWCVEVGSGTGSSTADLRAAFHDVVSVELSREMLRLSAVQGRQIQADAAALPLRRDRRRVVALINTFPVEVVRVDPRRSGVTARRRCDDGPGDRGRSGALLPASFSGSLGRRLRAHEWIRPEPRSERGTNVKVAQQERPLVESRSAQPARHLAVALAGVALLACEVVLDTRHPTAPVTSGEYPATPMDGHPQPYDAFRTGAFDRHVRIRRLSTCRLVRSSQ